MKARWRILVAASAALLGAAAPALAQETAAPVQNEVVGPPQLRDFSLNGTVTREAPEAVDVQPGERQATGAQQPSANAQTSAPRTAQPAREQAAAAARPGPAARQSAERSASASAADDLPPPTPARRIDTPLVGPGEDLASLEPEPTSVPAEPDPGFNASRSDFPILPWLIAALALIGAGGWYFLRQRPRESFAGAGALNAFEAPATRVPSPAPPVRTPPPAPQPKPPAGIVSTRLRPWLELEFVPQRAIVDEEKAAIAFELSVFNSGSGPARDILLEASLFNAGAAQDQQIRLFFENPVAKGDRIPLIPPMQRVTINTAVFLPREQIRPIEVEGRSLLVPMIAFNALYGWSGGDGQTSASYLVGKTTQSEKLAPFRLDLGPRVFRGLAAREHELRLRK